MNRKRRIAIVMGLIILATGGLVLARVLRTSFTSSPITLPPENEIESISAKINDLEESMGIMAVPEFAIPPRYLPTILSAVAPPIRYGYPPEWEQLTLGHITIATKDGRSIHISFCEAGKNKLCYSVDGVRCVRGGMYRPVWVAKDYEAYSDEGAILCGIVTEIYQELRGNGSTRLSKLMESLQRSKGEKPPERR